MAGLNKVMIIGHLGQDPDTRYTQGGDAVTTISVATSRQWKDKQTGEPKEKTEWHRCVFWGAKAETVGQYLKKGSKVYVEGELETRKWDDKDGVTRYTTEIRAFQFQFLDRKEGSRPPHPAGDQATTEPQKQDAPAQQEIAEDFDDDIPF